MKTYTITCPSIIAGVPTINNRIYSKDLLEKAIEEYNAKGVQPLYCATDDVYECGDIVGAVDSLELNDAGLIEAKIRLGTTTGGKFLSIILEDDDFDPSEQDCLDIMGAGKINENRMITSYTISWVRINFSPRG